MYALATSSASIYRGTTTDDYGDTVDDDTTPIRTGVPVSLLEQTNTVIPADGSTPSVVRYVAGRVAAGTDIKDGDRLLDERAGAKYAVDFVSLGYMPTGSADIQLHLRLIDTAPR